VIIHIDMDAFYASVEARDDPSLAGKPVVVGGSPQGRGVVAAASYEARRFGVHSAMPMASALRRCPQLIVLPVRMARYAELSQQIRAVFERYTPLIEPLSLDEAFLDVAASERLFGPADAIGARIKTDIRAELELVASVGVAPNKFLAKLASDLGKPDGFLRVDPNGVQAFLDPLPVTRLWGVGKAAAATFERLGVTTIAQARALGSEVLAHYFGKHGRDLWELAHGRDERPVVSDAEAKSISHETTFEADIREPEVLRAILLQLTEQVAWRLRRQGLRGRTVHLKARLADFTTLSRSQTLDTPTDVTQTLWQTVRRLFDERLPPGRPALRLIGMGVSGFDEEGQPAQADLFAEASYEPAPSGTRERALDRVADSINERFGPATLKRGGSCKNRR